MTAEELGFIHRFVAPAGADAKVTLLLLHGTGGNEQDLLPLGGALLPGAALLSPRGKILENGMHRFFRRLELGVFDLEDLKVQTDSLKRFITDASGVYQLQNSAIIAVGYSNGANIAGSLLLSYPDLLSGAILFRPMIPLRPPALPSLRDVPVLLAAGQTDQIVAPEHTAELAQMLDAAGARVSIHWHKGGHELGQDDMLAAKRWLAGVAHTL